MRTTADWAYGTALTGLLGLYFLLIAWNIPLTDNTIVSTLLILLITLTPLLLPTPGFLKKNRKSSVWLAYISLIYFLHGSSEAYVNALKRPYALLEVCLSLMIFFGSCFFVRLSRRY